jgi:hypothetical protein
LLSGLFAGLVATTACAAVSDDTQSTSAAFAHPGTGQRFLLADFGDVNDAVRVYNGTLQGPIPNPEASPGRLGAWKQKFMPASEPVVHALYRNKMELGFWRDMTCTKRFVRGGPGGCFVTNRGRSDDSPYFDLGTVAMNITTDGFVHFAVYSRSDGTISGDSVETTDIAELDNDGGKVTPYVCVNCHGGTVAGGLVLGREPDLGSVFREFEPSLLEAPPRGRPGYRRAAMVRAEPGGSDGERDAPRRERGRPCRVRLHAEGRWRSHPGPLRRSR